MNKFKGELSWLNEHVKDVIMCLSKRHVHYVEQKQQLIGLD